MPHHRDKQVVETTAEARPGVTGYNVRYMLLFSLGAVITIVWNFASGQ